VRPLSFQNKPKRITGRALQARRERKRQENPLCVRCLPKGITRPWTQLDHVIPLHKGGPDTDENTQGLCDTCHEEKTREDMGYRERQVLAADGWPVKP
jgi:5-methylcytosine-specific restriction protein A